MNSLSVAIIVSLILHAVILMIEPENPYKIEEKKNKGSQEQTKIKIKQGKDKIKISAYENSQEPCPKYYIGIGILQSWGDVLEVAKNGPAYKAGIQVGDTLLSQIDISKLKEGEVIDVTISRKGIILSYKIKVERICTDNEDR
jgi:predicted metalloprotease with PDZ domain